MKELTRIITGISSIINETISDSTVLKRIGNTAKSIIKKRTRDGFGVQGKLKPLQPSTIKRRRYKDLSAETSPSTSNLTESGQMLDSLKVSVKPKQVEITVARGDQKKVKDGTREFMGLTPKEKDTIADIIAKEITSAIKIKLK